jgi:hypothetical protein
MHHRIQNIDIQSHRVQILNSKRNFFSWDGGDADVRCEQISAGTIKIVFKNIAREEVGSSERYLGTFYVYCPCRKFLPSSHRNTKSWAKNQHVEIQRLRSLISPETSPSSKE